MTMSNQRGTTIGACEYSIEYLRKLKKGLCAIDAKDNQLNWGVGGIIITLVAYLIDTCDEEIRDSLANNKESKETLLDIQYKFDRFIMKMIHPE